MGSKLYKSLKLGRNEFRLFRIHQTETAPYELSLELRTHSLDYPPPYRAISFVWGDPNLREIVSVNGDSLEIPRSALEALPFLGGNDGFFWLDAVCINQKDNSERAQQVLAMQRIYSHAAYVIVWLGPHSEIIRRAFEFAETWTSQSEEDIKANIDSFLESHAHVLTKASYEAVDLLLRHNWFERIWTYQECVLAKMAVLMCGYDRLAFDKLYQGVTIASNEAKRQLNSGIKHRSLIDILTSPKFSLVDRMQHQQLNSYRTLGMSLADISVMNKKYFSLLPLMHFLHDNEATDPRDKIYALLGIIQEQFHGIVPDYNKSIESVYSEFTAELIRTDECLKVIQHSGIGIRLEEQAPKLELPSWVPDLRKSALWPYPYLFDAPSSEFHNPTPHVCSNFTNLTVTGVDYVAVQGVLESSSEMAVDWSTFIKTFKVAHPTGAPQVQAFIRTMISDPNSKHYDEAWDHDNQSKRYFFDKVIGCMLNLAYQEANTSRQGGKKFFETILTSEQNADYALALFIWLNGDPPRRNQYTDVELLEPFTGTPGSASFLPWPFEMYSVRNNIRYHIHRFMPSFTRVTAHRVLFWTSKGYIGLGPELMQPSDRICVIRGLNKPFLLRKAENNDRNQYYLVGECYVYGLMKGETDEHLRLSEVKEESFELI